MPDGRKRILLPRYSFGFVSSTKRIRPAWLTSSTMPIFAFVPQKKKRIRICMVFVFRRLHFTSQPLIFIASGGLCPQRQPSGPHKSAVSLTHQSPTSRSQPPLRHTEEHRCLSLCRASNAHSLNAHKSLCYGTDFESINLLPFFPFNPLSERSHPSDSFRSVTPSPRLPICGRFS